MVRTKSSLVSSSLAATPCQIGGQFIAIGAGRLALRQGGLLDFLPVLVQAGQKKRLLSQAPPRPGDDVGDHLLIGMAQVRAAR